MHTVTTLKEEEGMEEEEIDPQINLPKEEVKTKNIYGKMDHQKDLDQDHQIVVLVVDDLSLLYLKAKKLEDLLQNISELRQRRKE